jgi:hypothetical protein
MINIVSPKYKAPEFERRYQAGNRLEQDASRQENKFNQQQKCQEFGFQSR